MAKQQILDKDTFTPLDAFHDEAYAWAEKMLNVIDINKLKEKDSFIISLTFSYIFGGFIYRSMKYPEPNAAFEDFITDRISENQYLYHNDDDDVWDRLHKCRNDIYSLIYKVIGDPYKIFLTLRDAILREVESEFEEDEGKMIKIEPYDFNGEDGFGYVSNGFSW